MMTPQLTEQYGQVERVSLARAIFSVRSCAYAGFKSKPNIAAAAPPTVVSLIKSRRVGFIRDPRPQELRQGIGLRRPLHKTQRADCQVLILREAIAPLPKPGPCVSAASIRGRRENTAKDLAGARSCATAGRENA